MAQTIDSSHPLFLHPSDTAGVQLVSQQLTGVETYNLWSRSMRIALLAKNKLGFVDGTCRRDDYEGLLQTQWERCNALVLSWILNSVSQDLSAGIVFASNVEAVWRDLRERFDKIDGSRIFFLHRSIASLVQGDLSVSAYFTRLKLLWDEYTALVPFSTCDCEAAQQNTFHVAQQWLFQFLMGLNETYSAIRSQLLLMKPLPTVNQAYSMIVQEELHRTQLSASPIEASVMFTTASKGNDRRRFSGTCDYCKVRGHSRDRCYRLIGFPADFKFNKKKVPQAAMAVTSVPAVNGGPENGSIVSTTISAVPSFTSEHNSSAHWIIDTGATDHILSVFKGLQFPVSCSSHRFVHLPNGHTETITHIGSYRLNSEIVLSNVLFVPNFSHNLLSVSRLVKDHGCILSFHPDICILQDLYSGMIKGIGRRFNGLYIFESKGATGLFSNFLASTGNVSCVHSVHDISVSNKTSLWHARFGHASASTMRKLSSYVSDQFDVQSVHTCNVCPLAKQTRLLFPLSCTRSSIPFELIHIDLWGPYRISTHSGHRYFLTIVDDCTRMTWVYLLRVKTDTILFLKQFLSFTSTQFSFVTKVIRSDNGTEFFNSHCSPFFSSLGILHQSSCVQTPQQNGVAERKHRHLLEVARALRFQSKVPIKFWGECVLTSCFIINRLPSSVLQWKTPYELLYHKAPDMNILKVFGCLCYATDPKPTDKFSPRALPSVFMGYSSTKKGYLLFDLTSKKFLVNRDVIFHEQVFPFHFPVQTDSFFPSTPSVPDSDFLNLSFGQQSISAIPIISPSSVELGQSSQQLETPMVPVAPVLVRKSTRVPKQPQWLNDFICNSVSTSNYPISDFISYNHLPCRTQSFVSFISNSVEPKSYHEAIQHPEWVQAMKDEILALETNKTWSVASLPYGKVPIGCKWVYRIKYNAAGTIERYKARLVAKGYSQREGVDYVDTFSPVVKLVTVRFLLAIASIFDWPLFQLDVYNAFLQGDLSEEVYMELPPGFCSQGENMSKFDYSLFTMRKGNKIVVLLIYVDDLLITGNDSCLINDLKNLLNKRFKMKDLGELKYFLGFEIMRSKEGILINQRKYALELIEESGMSGSKPARTPFEQNVRLTTSKYDELRTKREPDITFAVHYLSQFMQQPKESHLHSALRIVRYIKGNPGQGILMDSNGNCEIRAYCDSDWAACPVSRRSVSGFCIKLGNSLISWKSKKQNVVARSSAEAEYRSMVVTTAELTWLNGLANELGLERKCPVKLYCDNKAALQIAANPVYHKRTKHIEIDCHFIREKIQEGFIKTEFVSSSEQLADIFTKALGVQQHEYLVSKLGMKNIFHPPT
ncbi:hypothetical protein F3Y22_tig00111843pilonHSYRG00119 [Hibiscus syriacus]|uniref:Integrase catalytic domain-containing protein n=1 Tax=Hibiscus syriacus TaxID=106335 RepID=A0A6A2YBU0_HIBSY|nr:hypothetical protein F3Y22_tig00111843pilonHSYRG00119 [Hibiscus syriacus]